MSRKNSHWFWIPSLYIAAEIPAAMVTYVALLMFIQFGAGVGLSSVLSGLLFLPRILKSYFRSKVRNQGNFKRYLHVVQTLMFCAIMGCAIYMTYCVVNVWVLFAFLLVVSCLCAWHELLDTMYYNRMLYPREQKLLNNSKMLVVQVTVVVTYGLLIIIAGSLQVFFRNYQKAWAMDCSVLAGVMLLMLCVNALVLKNPKVHNPYRYQSLLSAFQNEVRIIDRIKHKPNVAGVLTCLFFLLLPQALMFNSRVFFLLAPVAEGGLECSLQEVGFAQGTIGVIAFSVGISLGRYVLYTKRQESMFYPMAVMLTLSPVVYLVMALMPEYFDLPMLSVMTMIAQFLFGFGLNVCMVFVRFISEQRYRNTFNYLYIPLVALMMLVPVLVSGWLIEEVGYVVFFIINCSCIPLAWIALGMKRIPNS